MLLIKERKRKKTVLTEEQIDKVKQLYFDWQSEDGKYEDVPEYCKSATIEEISKQNYNLAPSKYIEFIDHDLEIDYEKEMARIQTEMQEVMKDEKKSQQMLENAFRGIGYGID